MSGNNLKIAIANDHGACNMAETIIEHIKSKGYEAVYFGVKEGVTADYPDKAAALVEALYEKKADRGILLCGSGIGISIAANRYPGIICALCHDECTARLSRRHNNSNVLAIGGRTTGIEVAKGIVDVWLSTDFEGGRHIDRINKIDEYAKKAWAKYFGLEN